MSLDGRLGDKSGDHGNGGGEFGLELLYQLSQSLDFGGHVGDVSGGRGGLEELHHVGVGWRRGRGRAGVGPCALGGEADRVSLKSGWLLEAGCHETCLRQPVTPSTLEPYCTPTEWVVSSSSFPCLVTSALHFRAH